MRGIRVTYVGHSTVLIEIAGRAFLTDPVFTARIATLRRKSPAGLAPENLPALSAVLVSHGHYDHLDVASINMLDANVPILIPPRAAKFLWGLKGRRFVEIAPGKSWQTDGIEIFAVPARHFGGRFLVDSWFRPAMGFVVRTGGACVYFAGDTAFSGVFAEIGSRFSPDVAILPIGAYRPRFVMRGSHMDPGEALQAFRDLGARFMIPVHWGAFELSLEPLDEPVELLSRLAESQGVRDRVKVLMPGSSWESPQ